jgi:hypothetical protein
MAQSFLRNGIAAGLACVGIGLALHGGNAQAVVVNVGGSNYDVTKVFGAANALPNLSAQPWFGNVSLAEQFAAAVTNQLGMFTGFGPYFATAIGTNSVDVSYFRENPFTGATSVVSNWYSPITQQYNFAQAQLQPSAPSGVPGPLPLFGAMAGYGMSRRLRARIQAASPRRMGC